MWSRGHGQIAGLVERFGDDPGKIADIPRKPVELVDQMLGERARGILHPVEIKGLLAAG